MTPRRLSITALVLTAFLLLSACGPQNAITPPTVVLPTNPPGVPTITAALPTLVPSTALPATAVPPTRLSPSAVPATRPLGTAVAPTTLPKTAVQPTSASGGVLPWHTLYFTNPNPPDELTGGVDKFVVEALNKAQKTIDLASFDFTLPSVADALIAAKKRGVQVRMIIDQVNGSQDLNQDDLVAKGGQPFKNVLDAGIPVVNGGRSNGLMHNKYIIIDSSDLFMGSWNVSYNDTFRNNNNLLHIKSAKLIQNYQAKFDEGFNLKQFGTKAKVTAINPKVTLDGVAVENYFSPKDKVMDKLIAEVNNAKKSVKFMIFTYTDKGLSAAMIDRFNQGVKVEGVIENRGASQGAELPLFCAGVPVKTDGNKYTMHHKVIVIDDSTVITGSFNFTNSADEVNDDNVLIIRSPAVAQQYLQEYAKISAQGATPDAAKITCPAK